MVVFYYVLGTHEFVNKYLFISNFFIGKEEYDKF